MERRFHTYRYPLSEVLPSLDELARYLHMEDTEHPAYLYMVERLEQLRSSDLEAVGGYVVGRVDSVEVAEGSITVEGVSFAVGAQVAGYLKEASEAALFSRTSRGGTLA